LSGSRTLLELESGFEVVGEAADGQSALEAFAELQPDVVLMDIRMPGMDGVEATRRLDGLADDSGAFCLLCAPC
jgi:YesN/AraC family two-component response regulator